MRANFAKGVSLLVISIAMVGSGLAGDPVQSGLKVGDAVEFDFVKSAQGDYALTRIVPVMPGGGKP